MIPDSATPDVVRRAAEKLAGSSTIAANRSPAPAPQGNSHNDEPFDTAPPPLTPSMPHRTVNISPTSLAAVGISLPSAGSGRTIEEFRLIKRQLLANSKGSAALGASEANRLIMVTSASPGDGKTFTAINLALAIAFERDLKVLLIDADVYRQSLMNYLGVKADAGWIDLLTGAVNSFSDVLLHTNIPNLTLLPAGKLQPEVPELISSQRMMDLATEMAKRYPDRFVIFDTLPCLASSEPAILAGLVGQTLFVVSALQTTHEEVEHSLSLITACPNVSLILNKAEPILTEQFGRYGYGYGYQQQ